ncbi:hypothetical protein L6164_011344 [Bauhinia variegata]|uniref:Uncharacterized protein n=1 Tax=Bauhinia variegata TaxID=167791 RepID=A0ACB9P7R1_BAUVA|nr:hypothetical protein L6164_011344 [Bauhinia variegata]
MTIDDESSIYIGGLPYDATEDNLHTVFDLYGAIVDIKIINDQRTRGKCYGFITFTNPRSAVDAINDMNGRNGDWDRSRGRDRDYNHDRDKDRNRNALVDTATLEGDDDGDGDAMGLKDGQFTIGNA